MNILKKLAPFVLIILLSYWAIAPFFLPEFFPIHDDTQVARVFEMNKALADGVFPVRWVSDLGYGYGYPIFNFYAPLAYYVGGFLNFATDSLTATKVMMVFGVLLAGVFMYAFAQALWGRVGGIISALLYIYAPYHALNIYVRGDVAEFWAYAFVPLAFLSFYKLNQELGIRNQGSSSLIHNSLFILQPKIWLWISIGAIGYACIILSHNLSAMMVTPFLIGFTIVLLFLSKQKKYFIGGVVSSLVIALLLSAFYWLPVFPELQYTDVLSQVGGGADYKDHFVCLGQLWDSAWGYGGSTKTCVDGLSFKIGKVHIVLGLVVTILFIFAFVDRVHFKTLLSFLRRQESMDALTPVKQAGSFPLFSPPFRGDDKQYPLITLFILGSLLVSLFLMLDSSRFIWDAITPMAFFQYPWRFLLMTSFFISLLGGASMLFVTTTKRVISYGVAFLFILSIIFVNSEVFVPQMLVQKTVGDYTNTYALRWEASKLTDEYLPPGFHEPKTVRDVPKEKIVIPAGAGEVTFFNEKTQRIRADIVMNVPSNILIQQAYFPAWHVFINGKEIVYEKTNKGMLIAVPQGQHTIELRFMQTPVEKLGNILSLAGILVLILGIIVSRKEFIDAKTT